MNVLNGPMMSIFSLFRNLIDIDSIIVRTNRYKVAIWGIHDSLAPLSWFVQGRDSLREIVVIKDVHITVIIAYSHVVVMFRISDGSCLLLDWVRRHGRSGRFDFTGFVGFSTHHVERPNFTLFYHFFIFNAVLVN